MTMWMVRAGRGGERATEFLESGIVAFGDPELGKLPPHIQKADLLRLYAERYPDKKEGSRASWASQLLRFLSEIKVGDTVLTFDPDRRVYPVGTVTSEYQWMPEVLEERPHVRRVEWTHEVARSVVGVSARNSLGAIQALFRIPHEVAAELETAKVPIGTTVPGEVGSARVGASKPDEVAGLAALREETIQKADGFIEDALNRLDWEEMQELVAGVLRAMGYRTNVSPRGSDRGRDISASPDGLMLQEPRIFVEVKHRVASSMDSKAIRSFLGGRKQGDRCLYVSTGGFTKDAHYEADRSLIPITLINLEGLRRLLVDNYDRLDSEARALVPLRKFYWPVVEG